MRWLPVIVFLGFSGFEPAFAQGVWYYCEDSRAYYPYVTTCRTPWRTVPATPQGQPPTQPQTDAQRAQEKLREQQEEARRKYQQELADREKKAAADGYKSMTFEDFQLDGKKLAATNAKVELRGVYLKVGEIEMLMPSSLAIGMMRELGKTADGIGLMSNDAPREIRKYFLECDNSPVASQLGCQITVLGHAEICEKTTLVGRQEVPCLVVEDGWQ